MDIDLLNALVSAVITAVIGIYPYVRRPSEVTKYFALANGSLAIWNLAQLLVLFNLPYPISLFIYRFTYLFGIVLVLFFFRFMYLFMGKDIQEIKSLWRGIVCFGGLLCVLLWTPFFISKISFEPGLPIQEVHGPAYCLFAAYMLGVLGHALFRLYNAFKVSQGRPREQLKYMVAALSFGFIEAVVFLISATLLTIPSYYYYLQVLYVLLVAYAILAHNLMDISVIIRKTVIYSVVTGVLASIMVFVAMLSANYTQGALGHQTFFALAVATCLITAIFHPLQLKVQAFVDRHLFRDWADREVVREVASGFSHELKSPLAGLSMQAQLAMSELDDIEKGKGSLREALPKIRANLRYILNQAMDAARRIEAVRGVAEPGRDQLEPVDVAGVVKGALSALNHLLGQTTVKVHHDIPGHLPAVQGYAKQLEIVFINLMKNAIESMEKGGAPSLLLVGSELNGSVLISVKDNGAGIPAKDLNRLFELNFTTKGHRGTGMGLYLSQQIVKAHGGSIEVKSEEGKGTEFIVRLPKFKAEKAA